MKSGAVGGIETVAKAMNTHIDNDYVCQQGCGALWNMAEGNGKNIGKDNKLKHEMNR